MNLAKQIYLVDLSMVVSITFKFGQALGGGGRSLGLIGRLFSETDIMVTAESGDTGD